MLKLLQMAAGAHGNVETLSGTRRDYLRPLSGSREAVAASCDKHSYLLNRVGGFLWLAARSVAIRARMSAMSGASGASFK